MLAGLLFALGLGFLAGLAAAFSQILRWRGRSVCPTHGKSKPGGGVPGFRRRPVCGHGHGDRPGGLPRQVPDFWPTLGAVGDRSAGRHRQQSDQLFECPRREPRNRSGEPDSGQQRDEGLRDRPLPAFFPPSGTVCRRLPCFTLPCTRTSWQSDACSKQHNQRPEVPGRIRAESGRKSLAANS